MATALEPGLRLYVDEYLDAIIQRARDGSTVADLLETLHLLPDGSAITDEEARAYVQELIDSEVLTSNLSPLVTGEPALDDIISQTKSLSAGSAAAETLAWARDRMDELDAKGPGAPPADYRAIAARLEVLPAKIDIAHLFQVDLIKPAQIAHLAQPLVDELIGALDLLCRVCRWAEPDELRRFREDFQSRYDRAWVPLVLALDEEAGLGFGAKGADSSPLLRGLPLGGGQNQGGSPAAGIESTLQEKMLGSGAESPRELVLDLSELPHRNDRAARTLADCFDIGFTIVAPSMQSVQEGDLRICMRGGAGPSGARLVGRFCHVAQDLEEHVQKLLRAEETHNPEAVYAEIVYLPEGRIGNVLCRPVLREFEITYLGRSGAPLDRQVPVSDLLVTVASEGTILLYSQRLKRRVIPRLANAHGFMNPALSSVYRFLCFLQHQRGVAVPVFNWGASESLSFLPRLRVGKVVLACARWRLGQEDVKGLDKESRSESFLAMQELRRKLGLPRWVLLSELDNTLPADLDNPLSVDALVHVIKRSQQATLTEMYPSPEDLCVTGPEGRFCHEILVPFVKRAGPPDADDERSRSAVKCSISVAGTPVDAASRTLPPGSDWLYLKIYGGPASLDDLLTTVVPQLLRAGRDRGLGSRSFFLLYADPQEHLRIRFQGEPGKLAQEFWPLASSMLRPLLDSGKISKIQLDTYEREVERYGGLKATLLAEEIFSADSDAVLEILKATQGDEGVDHRWQVALVGIDALLEDCGLNLEAKLATLERLRDAFQREFQAGVATKKHLGERFRRERHKLVALFDNVSPPDDIAAISRRVLATRSARISGVVRELRSLDTAGALAVPIPELVDSYVHMHVNRLIRSAQRAHEMVLYDFLFRIYDGKRAKARRADVPATREESAVD